jgi:hypothetical protein
LPTSTQKGIHVAQFISRIPGKSQPILVKGTNGVSYVLKFLNNPCGPNALFNEAAGNELFRILHLSVPRWERLLVTDEFLDENTNCWMEGPDGTVRPDSGACFGTRYLGDTEETVFHLLPESSYGQIRNRRSFWMAWLVDSCCGRGATREAIFLNHIKGGFEAIFIDFGSQFGRVENPRHLNFLASQYPDHRIYPPLEAAEVRKHIWVLQTLDLERLHARIRTIPREWWGPHAAIDYTNAISRLRNLRLVKSILERLPNLQTEKAGTRRERRWGLFRRA